jgi:hypothetical protein
MKIKEFAVINIEALKREVYVLRKNCEIFKEFNDHQAVASRMKVINTIESIIEDSKPLEPIIRDAYFEGKNNGFSEDKYINETQI